MTELRKRMLEELQRRNYSINTIRPYLYAVEDFARNSAKVPTNCGRKSHGSISCICSTTANSPSKRLHSSHHQ